MFLAPTPPNTRRITTTPRPSGTNQHSGEVERLWRVSRPWTPIGSRSGGNFSICMISLCLLPQKWILWNLSLEKCLSFIKLNDIAYNITTISRRRSNFLSRRDTFNSMSKEIPLNGHAGQTPIGVTIQEAPNLRRERIIQRREWKGRTRYAQHYCRRIH